MRQTGCRGVAPTGKYVCNNTHRHKTSYIPHADAEIRDERRAGQVIGAIGPPGDATHRGDGGDHMLHTRNPTLHIPHLHAFVASAGGDELFFFWVEMALKNWSHMTGELAFGQFWFLYDTKTQVY